MWQEIICGKYLFHDGLCGIVSNQQINDEFLFYNLFLHTLVRNGNVSS